MYHAVQFVCGFNGSAHIKRLQPNDFDHFGMNLLINPCVSAQRMNENKNNAAEATEFVIDKISN